MIEWLSTHFLCCWQEKNEDQPMALVASAKELSSWTQAYDNIDWEATILKDPKLANALGGQSSRPIIVGSFMPGNRFEHCTINIICNSDKENVRPN